LGTENKSDEAYSHLRAAAVIYADAQADEMGFIFEMMFSIIEGCSIVFYFSIGFILSFLY